MRIYFLRRLPYRDVGVTTGHVLAANRANRVDLTATNKESTCRPIGRTKASKPGEIFTNDLCGRLNGCLTNDVGRPADIKGGRVGIGRRGIIRHNRAIKQMWPPWIANWLETGFCRSFICAAAGQGFQHLSEQRITATLEAVGTGRPSEGDVPEARGERCACIAVNPAWRNLQRRIPTQCSWTSLTTGGLYCPYCAGGRTAFVSRWRGRLVVRGGILG